jgi:voltage-gated potassium channel
MGGDATGWARPWQQRSGVQDCRQPTPNFGRMEHESRLERRLDRLIARAVNPRKAAMVIASVTTVMTVGAGLLMRFLDHDNFPTIGAGLWWAVQTVTTVGYGDLVPTSVGGRLLAALVMLLGIGFVTVITASITGAFVARSSSERIDTGSDLTEQHLRGIHERLDRIEAALRDLA